MEMTLPDIIENARLRAQLALKRNLRRARKYAVILAIPSILFLLATAAGLLLAPVGGRYVALGFLVLDIILSAIILMIFAPGIGLVDALQELPIVQRFKEEIKSTMIIGNVAMFLGLIMTPLAFATLVDTTKRSALSFWAIVALYYLVMFLSNLGLAKVGTAKASTKK